LSADDHLILFKQASEFDPVFTPPHTSGIRTMEFTTLVGFVAAFCMTVSYYPQLKKCWTTGFRW
jgi:hypothetical protein